MSDNMTFNQEQTAVINISSGNHLVLAPPGCGKTAVLAERVRHALQSGIPPEQMACLTFTNRAARGMQERLQQADCQGLFVGNVHRFCSRFLFDAGVVPPESGIIDTDTSVSIIADYLHEDELLVLGDNKRRQQYSQVINLQHLMYQCRTFYPAQLIVHRDALKASVLRELCAAFGLDYTQRSAIKIYEEIEHYSEETPPVPLSRDAQTALRQLYGARCYENYKRQNQLLDFEDLLLKTYDYMSSADAGCYPHFSWIQVDEVQDLSPLQLAIIDLFTAPDATVVYLGDTQQAIFSFMGAQSNTLMQLRERCGAGHLHNFFRNYRSPRYLLQVYNTYGQQQLHISADLMPSTDYDPPLPADGLRLNEYHDTLTEVQEVARLVQRLYEEHPDETTAVVVAFNSDADMVSQQLRTPHFKISGIDVFATPAMRLLLAHLAVLHAESNLIAWANIMTGLKVYATNAASRKFIHDMKQLAILPSDLLETPGQCYTMRFLQACDTQDLVIFDTETTGVDVFEDEIAQIAAIRVRKGEVTDSLNIFLTIDRQLPPMLGDTPNPLVAEYGKHPHLSPAEGLQRFVSFASGAAILGHNATFDYQIMHHQMQRHCPHLSMLQQWPTYFDSLKLARLLCPRLKSYKLRDLLTQLSLEGSNSHLADDDIMATKSLADYCYAKAKTLEQQQRLFLSRHEQVADRFRNLYQDLFLKARNSLYEQRPATDTPAIIQTIQDIYRQLIDLRRIQPVDKWQHIVNYITHTLLTPASGSTLVQQLARHAQELSTLKEADLCGSVALNDRVFISTVHKAKGLEFDNVIVFDVVRDKFPSYYSQKKENASPIAAARQADDEEARKFYVAISRAKKRLFLMWAREHNTPWHTLVRREPSPYLDCIRKYFI